MREAPLLELGHIVPADDFTQHMLFYKIIKESGQFNSKHFDDDIRPIIRRLSGPKLI